MIVNRIGGKCQSCEKSVGAGKGFAYKNGFRWFVVCNSAACMKRLGLNPPDTEAPRIRKIDEDGFITMPFDRDALPLLRSLPGARWNPERKQWSVSIKPGDLPRVLEVAEKLQMQVPDTLRAQCEAGTEESRMALERAEKARRHDGKTLFDYQKKGVEFLALKSQALLADDMGLGKALVNGTPVLTPDGWQPIETLEVGDEVIGRNGKPVKVTGVYPQGTVKVFDVTFSDGRCISCCKDHLWAVQTPNDRARNSGRLRVMSMQQIVDAGLEDHNGNRKWFIPLPEPIEHCEKDFPVHPYVLGALLANGTFARAITHHGLPEQRARLAEYGIEFEHKDYDGKWSFYIKNADNLKAQIKDLNLQYKNCYAKSVPEQYFFGSIEQRLLLLQGLVDNDGTVSKEGMVVEYNTASSQLADDVVRLVRSLGGVVKVSTRRPKYTYKGEIKVGSVDHRIRIKLPNNLCPVTIPFKKDRFVANSKYPPALSIADVVPSVEMECTCISVDAEDKLFVTKDYIVTHNTVQTLVALPDNGRAICIVPAAVKYNWRDEIKMWRPDYEAHVCVGKNSFRLPNQGEIIIVNYDILPKWLEPQKEETRNRNGRKITKAVGPASLTEEQKAVLAETTIIADECQKVKNFRAGRSQKVTQLCRSAKRVWFLTGTPLMNRPTDLYGVLQSGGMSPLGGWNKFVSLFDGYKNRWGGYEFGMPSPEVPERMKRVMLRRLKSEVMKDLPPKTYQTLEVNDMSTALKKRLNEFTVASALLEGLIEKGDVTKKLLGDDEAMATLASKLDMTSLPSFEDFSQIRALLAEARIPAMLEEVESYEESDTPVIVFSAHKAPIKELSKREGWEVITGETPAEKRTNIVRQFQAGELKGVGLTIQAGGVGLTLTRASHALFVDLDWTPAWNIQAEDRLVRIGQTANAVLIRRMTSSHPLDKHMQALIEYKMELAYRSLENTAKYTAPRQRPLAQEVEIIQETEAELDKRIQDAEADANREIALGKLAGIAAREAAKVNDVPEPELTRGRKAKLREALDYMVGRCDGAIERDGMGFNRPDAFIGHWLYATGLREDDDLAFRVLERILVRYRRQLKGNFEEIWKPELESKSA